MNFRKLTINVSAAYCFFVSSIYMGVMWALHFFWYPGWHSLTLDNVSDHFVGPTSLATKFFTILVPIMLVLSLTLMILEWKTKNIRWATALIVLGIIGATLVGQLNIIPINKTIAQGVASQEELNRLLEKWMNLNNIRLVITTVMWGGCLAYLMIRKNNL